MAGKTQKNFPASGKVRRHGLIPRFVHWLAAFSIFSLFFSGFGQMPLYKRYMLTEVPGMAWSGNFEITLNMHYAGAVLLMFIVAFHLTYHIVRREFDIWPKQGDVGESWLIIKAMFTGGQEPPSEKYLAEQRVAYAFIGVNVIALIATGMFKVAKNIPGVEMSESLIYVSTLLHTLTSMLLLIGIIAHLLAFAVPANRNLLPGMFSGLIDAEYARHRHSKWWSRING
ncbi:cytochrome b/b6 domain-containing protein [Heliobacterium undosum]|uniref:Cytochrome b/b6 domain-containing protein n=1 Tax=Heliomicrobium undosum TaxID=121734 RepID=A0A845L080_9FIRM|nr:cytochrome b/b6 domain-containing protein [Heliomicrobium undosum]MZP29882.1 cytochrome b/b6 domain-containing protein [Heliomicrobium undosum]